MPTAVTEKESDQSRKRRKSPAEASPKKRRNEENGRDRKGRRDREETRRRDDDTRRTDKSSSSARRESSPSDRRSSTVSTAMSSRTMPGQNKSKEELAEELKSKELIYEAKMKIQERIKELGLPLHSAPAKKGDKFKETILRPEEASAFTLLHMEKMQKISEMKSRIAKGVTNLNLKTPALVLDAITSEKLAQPTRAGLEPPGLFMPSSFITKTEPKIEEKPSQLSLQKVEPDSTSAGLAQQEFLDPRLRLKPAVRQRRQFEFKQPGEYEKLAKIQRSKAKLERLQAEIEKAAKQTGISSAVKLAIVTPSGLPETSTGEYIPEVEWWDEVVLGNGKCYDDIPSTELDPVDRYANITDLVEHPIQLKPPDEPLQPQYIKASLTKKERKKLRRQNRREALKEKAEKIRLGLEKPPEAKLKISNLMRVLGTDAVQDPTKMEALVRKQMAERAQKHVEDNKNRKLTREEKAAKAIRKMSEDTSLAVHVGVYKLKSLANPAKKFKVMMNAKQLQMTGVIIIMEDINVVVLEGGPKQQKFFKNLMLNRIKWAEEIAGQRHVRKHQQHTEDGQAAEPEGERNECTLIWEGVVQKRAFSGEPRFMQASGHKQAREILDKHGVAHYWDLCYSTTVLLSDK